MYNEFIGVDLHSTQVTVHRIIIGERGDVERTKGQYPMERMETHFIASLHPGCAVCVEGGSTMDFARAAALVKTAAPLTNHPPHKNFA